MYGTPWHGEAAFAVPGKARINRIFILEHGAQNEFTPLTRSRAVGELFARSFPPFHSAAGLERTVSFLDRILDRVPCYQFQFAPDASAVEKVIGFHDDLQTIDRRTIRIATMVATAAFGELAEELLGSRLGFRFQAKGRSMWPLIADGEILHVQPVNTVELKVGDIVLFRQGAKFKAHRIIRKQKKEQDTPGSSRVGTQARNADSAITEGQIVGKIIAKESAESGAKVRLDSISCATEFLRGRSPPASPKISLSPSSGFAKPALLLFSWPRRDSLGLLAGGAGRRGPVCPDPAGTAVGGNTAYQGAHHRRSR